MFPVSGNRDLPVGPLAGQMYAHTGDHCGLVLEAEGGEVQTEEWSKEVRIQPTCGEKKKNTKRSRQI